MSDPNQPPPADPDRPADRTPTPPSDATTPRTTPAGPAPDHLTPPPGPGHQTAAPSAAAAPPAPNPGTYPPPPPPSGRATIGRVVRHRATQLVAVGLLGLVLGGGIVALADRDHHPRYGVGADRPGHSRFDERGERGDRGERGPDRLPGRDFER